MPVTFLRLLPLAILLVRAFPARAASFADLVQQVPAPPAESAGAFSAVTRWEGRVFVLHAAVCFSSSDGGHAWARQTFVRTGPKGESPALEGGWFTRTENGLWLGNREGALAWRFDPVAEAWLPWPAGAGAIAAAGTGDRLYALSADHVLRVSRDAGADWDRLLLPDTVRIGTFFDDLLADGDVIALRDRDAAGAQRAAYSLDGGATWDWMPAHAQVAVAQGCAYAFDGATLDARCEQGRVTDGLPFAAPRSVFSDGQGSLFAWSDAGLYALSPASGAAWTPLAENAALAGWSAGKDFLSYRRDGTLAWFSGSAAPVSLRRPHPGIHHGKWFTEGILRRSLLGRAF